MAGTTNTPTGHDTDAAAPANSNDAVLRAIHEHHANLGRELAERVADVLAAVRSAYGRRVGDPNGGTSGSGTPDDEAPDDTAPNARTSGEGEAGETPGSAARTALSAFLHDELLPHAAAEEQTLYAAAADDAQIASLTRAMIDEHGVLTELAGQVADASDPVALAAAAEAVRTLFAVHVHKENTYLLPALDSSGTDLEALLSGMHRLLTGPREEGCGHDH